MKPRRILHIIGTMNRGGAETLVMELYRHIDRTKVQFDFLVYNYSDAPGAYDGEIRGLGGNIFNARCRFYREPLRYGKEIIEFLDAHPEYRIVHAHLNKMSGYNLAAAKKKRRITTIAHSHAAFSKFDPLRRIANNIGKKLIKKNADYIFGCSEDALRSISDHPSDGQRIFRLPNAIDLEKFSFSLSQRIKWRDKLGADQNTQLLGYVARFSGEKNHAFLLDTYKEYLNQNGNSKLILIGDGPDRRVIENLTQEKDLSAKVVFLGVRDDVHNILNALDVFIMPSKSEGLGIVLIEAQANGLPCVISADVIPHEADVGAGLVTRVSLQEGPEIWAEACLKAPTRITGNEGRSAAAAAGYDINEAAQWLQNFYIEKWNAE